MAHPSLRALALTHVDFEDLDGLQPLLSARGYQVSYLRATDPALARDQIDSADLLIVLGGPIGVYECDDYPFLRQELDFLRNRLDARRPTVGICLGAQLIAAALGARVYPGANGSEIGWSPLSPGIAPTPEWFKPYLTDSLEVLHWHGDTFDLPAGAQHLAGSELYSNQAFAMENFALGLQFHAEVTAEGLERWYVGHTGELRAKKISIPALRQQGEIHAPKLQEPRKLFWNGWLDYIL